MKKYSKEEAIEIVVSCAEAYSRELLNKSLLLVCQDKHNQVGFMEFFFYDRNFLHLTGLKPKRRSSKDNNGDESQNSKDFFYNCLSHTVSPENFEFCTLSGTGCTLVEYNGFCLSTNKTKFLFYQLKMF